MFPMTLGTFKRPLVLCLRQNLTLTEFEIRWFHRSTKCFAVEQTSTGRERRNLIGPSARALISHHGIDLTAISGSGPFLNILKSDVLNYIKSQGVSPKEKKYKTPSTTSATFVDTEITNMRNIIAKRLSLSKGTLPHAYMNIDCNLNEIFNERELLKKAHISVSLNDFVIRATALALSIVNEVNVSFDASKNTIKKLQNIDISIAVATKSGLITPIVKFANQLKVEDISSKVKWLAEKAKHGKLKPEEFQGGTFSISNLGMFGIDHFIAVINPPQSAILAVGKSRTIKGENTLNKLCTFTLSFDPRAIDEEDAARFIEAFRRLIEDPKFMAQLGDGSNKRRLGYLNHYT